MPAIAAPQALHGRLEAPPGAITPGTHPHHPFAPFHKKNSKNDAHPAR